MKLLLISPDLKNSRIYQPWDEDETTLEQILQSFRHDLWQQGHRPEARFEEFLDWFVFSVTLNAGEPEVFCKGKVKDLDYGIPKLHNED